MDVSSVVLWLYIVPLIVILLPGTLAFSRLGDMGDVTKKDIQLAAVLPLFNLYMAFCLVDVVITSTVDYIRNAVRAND